MDFETLDCIVLGMIEFFVCCVALCIFFGLLCMLFKACFHEYEREKERNKTIDFEKAKKQRKDKFKLL